MFFGIVFCEGLEAWGNKVIEKKTTLEYTTYKYFALGGGEQ